MRSERSRRGANAIEFALLAPVMLALLTGIIDYGWAATLRESARAAAYAGARAGSVTDRTKDPNGVAANAALKTWNSFHLGPKPTIVAFRSGSPERVNVRVTLSSTTLIGFVPTPPQLRATASERMEQQP